MPDLVGTLLQKQGFQRSSYNHNLYMFLEANLCVFIVLLYVDNLLITGTHEAKVVDLEQKLEQEFEMSKLGLLTYYRRIEFVYLQGGTLLLQRNYIQTLLKKFKMIDCAPVATTPMEEGNFLVVQGHGSRYH